MSYFEIEVREADEKLDDFRVIDVREPHEFEGPLGRIPGAKFIPLGQLSERAGELSADTPIVAVCRAGGRSAQATLMLRRAGFEEVANLAGGMLRWRAQRGTVEGASE